MNVTHTYLKEYNKYEMLSWEMFFMKQHNRIDSYDFKSMNTIHHTIKSNYAVFYHYFESNYTYNKIGDLIKLKELTIDNVNKSSSVTTYSYDYNNNGKLVKKSMLFEDNDFVMDYTPINYFRIIVEEYIYDEYQQIIIETKKISKKYDKPIEFTSFFEFESEEINEYTNIYNELGQIKDIIDSGTNDLLHTHEYDGDTLRCVYNYKNNILVSKEYYYYNDLGKKATIEIANKEDILMQIKKYIYTDNIVSFKIISPFNDNLRWFITEIFCDSVIVTIEEDTVTPEIVENIFKYATKYLPLIKFIEISTRINDPLDFYTFENENEQIIKYYSEKYNLVFSTRLE